MRGDIIGGIRYTVDSPLSARVVRDRVDVVGDVRRLAIGAGARPLEGVLLRITVSRDGRELGEASWGESGSASTKATVAAKGGANVDKGENNKRRAKTYRVASVWIGLTTTDLRAQTLLRAAP